MVIKPILWKAAKNDGSHSIKIYVQHNKKCAYYTTPFFCRAEDFKNGEMKKYAPNAILINQKLQNICAELTKLVIENMEMMPLEIINRYRGKNANPNYNKIVPFINYYVTECKAGNIKRAVNTIKKYITTKNLIAQYDPDLRFESINKNFYIQFTGKLRNEKGYKENSIGAVIKAIKMFINEANDMGMCNVHEHKKKYFKATANDETDAIYLNDEEIARIINLDLTQYPHLQAERDRFIVSTFLLLRHSDSLKIAKEMFFEHNKEGKNILLFRQRSQKVGTEVVIPIKPIVRETLERYDYSIPTDTNQESNWKIKEIGRLAGITNVISINGETGPKYQFISTHTARRSGATNLYIAGVSSKIIMALGGWKKEVNMLKYIRVTNLETAISIADHPHFSA
ncbi:MAG: phage integrase SAM-like domain-containing protein [Rickettsiaceae bacterium]|nr:phage integrase SAM-like domain-containing protein [Rickettsiaceae bacterium]